jgi:crotonobetainyl-CoA:carnitine CoA-transferase CaiB-like acyl-CoA transferase
MLSPYRVLDLTGQRGMIGGYLLAHLGAKVIAVEPPEGSPARKIPPFAGSSGEGLWWQSYARGKQSLVLDLESQAGRAALRELILDVDFVIESFSHAEAHRYGLDYDSCAEINPRLILISITPFGRGGPKAYWPATDLTIWAASGAHVLAGDNDRAPVRTSVPQAFLHAGADAACAALIALRARHDTGLGQHVDVSAQQSSAQACLSANLTSPNNSGMTVGRYAGGVGGQFPVRLTWPCRDGYVAITLLFASAFTEPNRRLLRWLQENGACSSADVECDWGERFAEMAREGASPQPYFDLCDKIEAFTRNRTQQQLFEEGLRRGVYIAPTFDIAGLLEEPHFKDREFWHEIQTSDAERSHVRVPGAFAKFSRMPLVVPGVAPRIGNYHDATVYKKNLVPTSAEQAPMSTEQKPMSTEQKPMSTEQKPMSTEQKPMSTEQKPMSTEQKPMSAAQIPKGSLPLAGLRVLDFMWVIAGPFCTRVLADYGATVIKVESSKRLEPARASPSFKDGEPGMETSVPFANFNAGKLGITVDPGNPVGREVILDLVRWADVVTESFSPKAMKTWGLDYATLRQVNPDLIMLSSCLMGQSGSRSEVAGYGNMAAAITGFYDLTGWSDRSPAGPYLAYTDGVSPRFMLVSLLAALEHRRRTGEGQHIDVSQAEAAIHMLAPAILDHELNGHVWHRMGNRDLELCPHGVYPALGDDRWVAIACQSDTAWLALCDVMGFADERSNSAFRTAVERFKREDELDLLISNWTGRRDEKDIQARLVRAGVAAHALQNSAECMADPQLTHRNHFVGSKHSSSGEIFVEGTRFKLSRTPGRVDRSNPELGEHNLQVLTEILGYDAERVADVFASLAMD